MGDHSRNVLKVLRKGALMILVGLAAAIVLAGCAERRFGTWPAFIEPRPKSGAQAAEDCPPLPKGLQEEARRLTPISREMQTDLIVSEIDKNLALREAIRRYEACRRRRLGKG